MDGVENGFQWPVRVYYEDTDAGGVVYHSQYLNYCERARTEWLRALGIEQPRLLTEQGLIFVVHRLQAHYQKPAKFDDLLTVDSRVVSANAVSVEFEQRILREQTVVFKAAVKVACVDAGKQRAAKMPAGILALIKGMMSTKRNDE